MGFGGKQAEPPRAFESLETGERVRGRVLEIQRDAILVELDGKTLGTIDPQEFGEEPRSRRRPRQVYACAQSLSRTTMGVNDVCSSTICTAANRPLTDLLTVAAPRAGGRSGRLERRPVFPCSSQRN